MIVLPTSYKVRSIEEVRREVRRAVEGLGEEERRVFYGLSEEGGDGNGEAMSGEDGREMRIVRTNSVTVGEGKAGVFRTFPR